MPLIGTEQSVIYDDTPAWSGTSYTKNTFFSENQRIKKVTI